jgi:8-oxo-dGTP diphosphatase
VRAAGGVVWREAGDGIEFAVVHRPRYDDWSLPKGKLLDGEDWLDGAVREVREETGLSVETQSELESARYRDRKGRDKLVRWWSMRAVDGGFEPNDEVDELRWLGPADAIELLDYEHDRRLVSLVAGDARSNKRPG